jgi:hypothetical protein
MTVATQCEHIIFSNALNHDITPLFDIRFKNKTPIYNILSFLTSSRCYAAAFYESCNDSIECVKKMTNLRCTTAPIYNFSHACRLAVFHKRFDYVNKLVHDDLYAPDFLQSIEMGFCGTHFFDTNHPYYTILKSHMIESTGRWKREYQAANLDAMKPEKMHDAIQAMSYIDTDAINIRKGKCEEFESTHTRFNQHNALAYLAFIHGHYEIFCKYIDNVSSNFTPLNRVLQHIQFTLTTEQVQCIIYFEIKLATIKFKTKISMNKHIYSQVETYKDKEQQGIKEYYEQCKTPVTHTIDENDEINSDFSFDLEYDDFESDSDSDDNSEVEET